MAGEVRLARVFTKPLPRLRGSWEPLVVELTSLVTNPNQPSFHEKTPRRGVLHEMAGEVRFELTMGANPRQFSRLVHSTALPLTRFVKSMRFNKGCFYRIQMLSSIVIFTKKSYNNPIFKKEAASWQNLKTLKKTQKKPH